MSAQEPVILVNSGSAVEDIVHRIHAIVPSARIISGKDLDADPALIEQVDYVFGRLSPEQFPQARRLKWVQGDSAGMDWARKPQVQTHPAVLTNARIHGVPISEHLFGLLLMLVRGLHVSLDHQRQGQWRKPPRDALGSLWGRTLCVVGLGQIGRRCARLGRAFDMRVIGVRRRAEPVEGVEQVFTSGQLHQALRQADVVMLVLPGTQETRRLIGPAELAAMKPGALLLNAGRGRTVDTDALVEALRSGQVSGAGLDVVDPEPLPPGHPLWTLPNVLITPHCSGHHPQYSQRASELFLENLRRILQGQPLAFVVDKQQGY